MSPGILGKKIGMTQVFTPEGQVVPVTLVKAGPCVVTQRKTPATDGYDAVQLGLVEYAKKPNQADGAAFGEVRRGRRAIPAGISLRAGYRRPEAGRPSAGRRVQAEGRGRCHWHEQGPRLCGRSEAASFPGRRCHPRVDVSPRAGFDWRI